jgi:hypothetical protein
VSSKPSKVEPSGGSLLKKISRVILGGLLIAAAAPFLIIWYGEKGRQDLMRDYQVPQIFLARVLALQQMPVKKLFEPGETLVCAVHSYAGVEGVEELNEKQRRSTPKDQLPSEDGIWYLIFFSETRSTRIYLIESAAINGITTDSDRCVGVDGSFEVIRAAPRDIADFKNGYYVFSIRMKRGI